MLAAALSTIRNAISPSTIDDRRAALVAAQTARQAASDALDATDPSNAKAWTAADAEHRRHVALESRAARALAEAEAQAAEAERDRKLARAAALTDRIAVDGPGRAAIRDRMTQALRDAAVAVQQLDAIAIAEADGIVTATDELRALERELGLPPAPVNCRQPFDLIVQAFEAESTALNAIRAAVVRGGN